jgi:hypothetical protein
MDAMAQNAAVEYANGPQAHTIFSFQVDAFLSPTERVARLKSIIDTLHSAGTINQGQANSFTKKLDQAQSAIDSGQMKVAFNLVGAFGNEVNGLLKVSSSDPLLTDIDTLLQRLEAGGF